MDDWMHVKKQPATARSGAVPGQPPGAAPPPAQPPPPLVESPEEARATLANLFQSQYYGIMSSNPASAYCFYYDESVVSRSDPAGLGATPPVSGIRDINEKILKSGLAHAQTSVASVDHQPAVSGVLVVVAGTVLLKGEPAARRFVQVFLLVNRSNSYYISNDVHRLLDLAPSAPLPPMPHPLMMPPAGLAGHHVLAAPSSGPPHDPAVLAVAAGPHVPVPASAPHAGPAPAQLPAAAVRGKEPPRQPQPQQQQPQPAPSAGAVRGSPPLPPTPQAGAPPAAPAAQQQPARSARDTADGGARDGGKSSWATVAGKAGGAQQEPQREALGHGEGLNGVALEPSAPRAAAGGVAEGAERPQPLRAGGDGGEGGGSISKPLAHLALGDTSGVAPPEAARVKPRAEARAGAEGAAPGARPPVGSNNSAFVVYVSAVPPSAEADALKAAFAQHGSVRSVHWRKDKGFAFVEFASARDAQSALAASNAEQGIVVSGMRLSVEPKRVAQPPPPRGGEARGGGPSGRRGRGRGGGGDARGGT